MLTVPMKRLARGTALAGAPILFALLILVGTSYRAATRQDLTPLLSTGKTVLGQTISYPVGAPAKVTAMIITILPGQETGWHKHDVPLFGYVLDGELTVDYGPAGKRVYHKGEALMEAIETAHNGRNLGNEDVRLLAVFMGADGVPNTLPLKEGAPPAAQ